MKSAEELARGSWPHDGTAEGSYGPDTEGQVAFVRAIQADALEHAATVAHTFQDVVGWQPGESRNAFVADIEAAIRKAKP